MSSSQPDRIRLAILTISDKASSGEREDAGGPAIRAALDHAGVGYDELDYRVIPDEEQRIGEALFHLSERTDVDLILTTGGTGLAPRDVTPQATLHAIDYQVPGIAEAMRAASLQVTAAGMLSRGVAGVRKRTLIINLPGNPKAVRENLAVIAAALPHAVGTLRGEVGEHSRPAG
ncbi:MAG TPA: MogA/MoaB family molybdenum cofactor biosynthesis protein [Chloroflexota bacterium]|jgi:molybdenum cofactor synthesis domain-containing protein|nr:MogA/MoaB family molybdenum cofactor biosynthesis protein [Chloroflexota bacterium]